MLAVFSFPEMYSNWNKNERLIFDSKWYEVNAIIDYLHYIKLNIMLNTFQSGINAPPSYPKKTRPAVSSNKRFPRNENYLCESIGDWYLIFTTIQVLTSQYIYGITENGLTEIQLISLINQLLCGIMEDQLVDRDCFELYYNLYWQNEFYHNLDTCDNVFCILFKKFLYFTGEICGQLRRAKVSFYKIK